MGGNQSLNMEEYLSTRLFKYCRYMLDHLKEYDDEVKRICTEALVALAPYEDKVDNIELPRNRADLYESIQDMYWLVEMYHDKHPEFTYSQSRVIKALMYEVRFLENTRKRHVLNETIYRSRTLSIDKNINKINIDPTALQLEIESKNMKEGIQEAAQKWRRIKTGVKVIHRDEIRPIGIATPIK
jgi:hypothetical protein